MSKVLKTTEFKIKSGVRIAREIRDQVEDVINTFENNEHLLQRINQELEDVKHIIEFSNYGTVDAHKIYARQRELLRDRRRAKKEQEVLEQLYNTLKDFNDNKKLVQRINNAIGACRKSEQRVKNKVYQPRFVGTDKEMVNKLAENVDYIVE